MHEPTGHLIRELIFRTACRHRQGARSNVVLFCTRRGGSTWLLNALAAHPGMRYLGRPFMSLLDSRWAGLLPDLDVAAGGTCARRRRHMVHFAGKASTQFDSVASRVVAGSLPIGQSLAFRSAWFHARTDRVALQMTSCMPMIEHFDKQFDVATVLLMRHPISNALSIEREGWQPECFEFLEHEWFRDTQLAPHQVDKARRIEADGSLRERHVLDWCLKMLVPLRALDSGQHADWLSLSYERMALDPRATAVNLSAVLDLPDCEAILNQLQRPSRTVTDATREKVHDPTYLVSRWRERVSPSEEQQLMAILDGFELDAYSLGVDEPAERF